jgi:hypothetical protein
MWFLWRARFSCLVKTETCGGASAPYLLLHRRHKRLSGAVVSSSNMSDNGLQLFSDGGNLEAGMFVGRADSDYGLVNSWGWQCWMDSTEVVLSRLGG